MSWEIAREMAEKDNRNTSIFILELAKEKERNGTLGPNFGKH